MVKTRSQARTAALALTLVASWAASAPRPAAADGDRHGVLAALGVALVDANTSDGEWEAGGELELGYDRRVWSADWLPVSDDGPGGSIRASVGARGSIRNTARWAGGWLALSGTAAFRVGEFHAAVSLAVGVAGQEDRLMQRFEVGFQLRSTVEIGWFVDHAHDTAFYFTAGAGGLWAHDVDMTLVGPLGLGFRGAW